jgi:hypothetical protein
MLTVTAIAADHLSSTFTNYIRAMADYRDCPKMAVANQLTRNRRQNVATRKNQRIEVDYFIPVLLSEQGN